MPTQAEIDAAAEAIEAERMHLWLPVKFDACDLRRIARAVLEAAEAVRDASGMERSWMDAPFREPPPGWRETYGEPIDPLAPATVDRKGDASTNNLVTPPRWVIDEHATEVARAEPIDQRMTQIHAPLADVPPSPSVTNMTGSCTRPNGCICVCKYDFDRCSYMPPA
jgi:hypothetical protein